MGFKEVVGLDCDNTVALGGRDKTGKPNLTKVEGYYLGSKEVESKMSKTGKAKIHVFQTPKGNLGVWGKTDLDRKMISATPGSMTRATFTGLAPAQPGRKPMYKFKVEVDSDNSIEVSSEETNISTENNNSESEEVNSYDDSSEADVYEDEAPVDVITPTRLVSRTATTGDAAALQAKVQGLLNRSKANR